MTSNVINPNAPGRLVSKSLLAGRKKQKRKNDERQTGRTTMRPKDSRSCEYKSRIGVRAKRFFNFFHQFSLQIRSFPFFSVEIVYNGTAGASATKDDHAAKYAFQNTAKYWGGRHNNKGPSIVWFHFRTAH